MTVMLQVNDANSGRFSGRLRQIEFGELELEHILAVRSDGGVSCVVSADRKQVTVAGRDYRVYGYSIWAGNWCWDCVRMTAADAADLLNFLVRNGGWHCNSGPSELFTKVNSQRPVFAEELAAMA